MPPFSRRPGVPPAKPSEPTDTDVRALQLMGDLLDLGATPSLAAETMTMLAEGRTRFVTELKKADEEWTADRAAQVDEEDRLPDFLDDDHPASKTPPANQPHSLNVRLRPGVRR